ncbi:MAG: RNA-binding domain-containing protein [Nitrospirota bacterium]
MVRDLFRIDLDDLTFNDILHFTGILRPEIERPQENVRLDFNEEIPDDLGDVITAFANTYGGLVIIGVKADKSKQNIPVEIPAIQGKPDIKSTIVNKILSTVYPRPPFSLGVAMHDDKPDHVVVVIRVDESRITPHMYIAGHKNKISIRVGDENRYASLQQIESLFERRDRLASKDFVTGRLDDLWIFWKLDDGDESRSGNYHKVALMPFDDLNIRLDRNSEVQFEKLIRTKFKKDKSLDADHRHARYYQIEARNKDVDYHRIWRLYSSGVIEFISQIGKGTPRQENLGDMIIDTIFTIEVYKTLVNEKSYFGRTYLQHEISIVKTTQLLPKMPPPHNIGNYDTIDGVRLEKDTVDAKSFAYQHTITRYLDFSDLQNPEGVIADSFLEHLRMIFHGRIDFDKLLENIRWLRKNNI